MPNRKVKSCASLGRQLIKSKDKPKFIKVEGFGSKEGFRNHVTTTRDMSGGLSSILEQTTLE